MSSRSFIRPGGLMAARPLHFIWLADCSGSMKVNGKIQSLNHAIRETLPHMCQVAAENSDATVLVRAMCFGQGARWHEPKAVPVAEYRWNDVVADDPATDLGKALELIATEMRSLATREKVLRPVLVLVTDGKPTDDFEAGLKALLSEPLGRKTVRIAIAIGDDADHEPLQQFIDDPTLKVLQANNSESLVSYIQWASTAVLKTTTMVGAPIPQQPSPIKTDGPSFNSF